MSPADLTAQRLAQPDAVPADAADMSSLTVPDSVRHGDVDGCEFDVRRLMYSVCAAHVRNICRSRRLYGTDAAAGGGAASAPGARPLRFDGATAPAAFGISVSALAGALAAPSVASAAGSGGLARVTPVSAEMRSIHPPFASSAYTA
jgi:hypothetical protein